MCLTAQRHLSSGQKIGWPTIFVAKHYSSKTKTINSYFRRSTETKFKTKATHENNRRQNDEQVKHHGAWCALCFILTMKSRLCSLRKLNILTHTADDDDHIIGSPREEHSQRMKMKTPRVGWVCVRHLFVLDVHCCIHGIGISGVIQMQNIQN